MTRSWGVFYTILNIMTKDGGELQLYNLYVITMLHSIHSIDATKERLSIARLINHSRTNPNLIPKVIELDGKPRLYFIASKR